MDSWELGSGGDEVVTEVVYLPIKSGLNPTEVSKTLHLTLSTIASQPGCLSNHYNYIYEASLSHTFEIHSKWLSLKHHQDFMNSEIYGKFYNEVKDILAGDVSMFHVKEFWGWKLDDDSIKKLLTPKGEVAGDVVANAHAKAGEEIKPRSVNPAIEIALFFSKENTGFVNNMKSFIAKLQEEKEKIDGLLGANVSSVLEKDLSPFFKEGEKGYGEGVMVMIAWTDVEAHLAFRDGELYKEVVGMIAGFGDLEMHHIELLEFKK